MYFNSDKTFFINVTKICQKHYFWHIFVTFLCMKWNTLRKHSKIKSNKNVTKHPFCYIFDTFLVQWGNILETFQSKKVTKICQKSNFWQFFVTFLSFKGHSWNSKAIKGHHQLIKYVKKTDNYHNFDRFLLHFLWWIRSV